jgi:putative ABC transport system permease protein
MKDGIFICTFIITHLTDRNMFRAYLAITMRNLLRRPGHTVLNFLGLSIGIAVASITALYLHHELSHDAFHKKSECIFRISGKQNDSWFAALSAPYSNFITENQIPEIESYARIRRWPPKYLRRNDDRFYERKVFFTDVNSGFFEMFDFKAIDGNLNDVFREPNSVVLTKSTATRIFGTAEAVGQTLMFDTLNLNVTAVIEDLPSNSNFDFRVLISNQKAMEQASALFTYCVISEAGSKKAVMDKLSAFGVPSEDFSKLQDIQVIPLRDLHFEGNMVYEIKPAANTTYLVVFLIIGVAVLVLSVFNFVNLSVAVYSQRVKEIAIRKIVGAARQQISSQFLIESIATTLIGLPLILILIGLLLPWFNAYMGVEIENYFFNRLEGRIAMMIGVLVIGLVAGIYPAWVLPRISSLIAFRNNGSSALGSWNLRTILVSLQITAMVIIFTASWIINQQLNFLNEKDLGFEKEGVIKLKGAWTVDSVAYARIKSRLLQHPSVVSVSNGFAPGDEDYGFAFRLENSEVIHNDLIAFGTDQDYIGTLGLKLVKLREGASLTDASNLVLVNETLVKKLGLNDPIGQCVVLSPGKNHERRKVIDGVFADFHFFSLHQGVSPLMLTIRPFGSGINENILVKVKTSAMAESFGYINKVVKEESPDVPLTGEFLDETLANQYKKEQQLSFFSKILLVITILLSAIGLVGLASYMITQKTKEIGIRKVLGATVRDVVLLIGKPFFRMTILAFLIGSTISFFVVQQWLESFAYRIPTTWIVFLFTLGGMFLLLSLTVGSHAIRAANTDPVKAIRSE